GRGDGAGGGGAGGVSYLCPEKVGIANGKFTRNRRELCLLCPNPALDSDISVNLHGNSPGDFLRHTPAPIRSHGNGPIILHKLGLVADHGGNVYAAACLVYLPGLSAQELARSA